MRSVPQALHSLPSQGIYSSPFSRPFIPLQLSLAVLLDTGSVRIFQCAQFKISICNFRQEEEKVALTVMTENLRRPRFIFEAQIQI